MVTVHGGYGCYPHAVVGAGYNVDLRLFDLPRIITVVVTVVWCSIWLPVTFTTLLRLHYSLAVGGWLIRLTTLPVGWWLIWVRSHFTFDYVGCGRLRYYRWIHAVVTTFVQP